MLVWGRLRGSCTADELVPLAAAYQDIHADIMVLSTDVLERLLDMRRTAPTTQQDLSTASSSSGSANGAGSGSSSALLSEQQVLLEGCEQVVALLVAGLLIPAQTFVVPNLSIASSPWLSNGNLPGIASLSSKPHVEGARLYKLLQEYVRLKVAAAAATPAGGSSRKLLTGVVKAANIILMTPGHCDDVWGLGGALVAPVAAARSASSPDALQLFGLLCSIQKVFNNSDLVVQVLSEPSTGFMLPTLGWAWTDAVDILLQSALHESHAAALSATLPQQAACSSVSDEACAAVLPWLVLLGRCCMSHATMVQFYLQLTQQAEGTVCSSTWPRHRTELVRGLLHITRSLDRVVRWLAGPHTVQQLSALGYQPQDLQQQLRQAGDALFAAISNDLPDMDLEPKAPAAAVLAAMQQQLQEAGSVLACFAIPHACNNPTCANVAGPSEARLVGGRSCICAGCHTARYCGRDPCQRGNWRQHKPVCRALAAAAEAAAAQAAAEPVEEVEDAAVVEEAAA